MAAFSIFLTPFLPQHKQFLGAREWGFFQRNAGTLENIHRKSLFSSWDRRWFINNLLWNTEWNQSGKVKSLCWGLTDSPLFLHPSPFTPSSIYLIYICVLCVRGVCAVPGNQKRALEAGVTGTCEPCGCWELNRVLGKKRKWAISQTQTCPSLSPSPPLLYSTIGSLFCILF